jgi:hypothetical protein
VAHDRLASWVRDSAQGGSCLDEDISPDYAKTPCQTKISDARSLTPKVD